MAVTITHRKVSQKPARTDNPSLVDSADWNDTHDVEGTDVFAVTFGSLADAEAAEIDITVQFLQLAGYYEPGDGGGGLYAKVGSEPAHPGKFQSADESWWELSESEPNPLQFGAVADGADTMDPILWSTNPVGHIRGDWVTATAYAVNNLVWDASTVVSGFAKRYGYRCLVAHTSGTFATDLAAGKWVLGAFSGTANTEAFQNCWAYAAAKTKGYMRIKAGTYRLDDTIAAAGTYVQYSQFFDMTLSEAGCNIVGDGRELVTLLIDEDVEWSIGNLNNRSVHGVFGAADQSNDNRTARPPYHFRSFGIRGRWMHRPGGNNGPETGGESPNWIGPNFSNLTGSRHFSMVDVKVTDIRGKAMRMSHHDRFTVEDCVMERCARGFIKSNTQGEFSICRNRLIDGDDDGIDLQVANADVGPDMSSRAPEGGVIEGNYIRNNESGIVCGVHRNVRIANNELRLIHTGGGVLIVSPYLAAFQKQPFMNVAVVNNQIVDPVIRIDLTTGVPLNNDTDTDGIIMIETPGRTIVATDLTGNPATQVYPGHFNQTSLAFVSEESVNRMWTMDVTALRSGPSGDGLVVHGNQIKRTVPDGLYSSWSFGLQFSQIGYVDGTYDIDNFPANGILIDNDLNGASITGNTISGYFAGSGIRLRAAPSLDRQRAFKDIVIANNTIRKMASGITKDVDGATVDYWSILIHGNRFNLDPLHINASRTSPIDGSWAAIVDTLSNGKGIWLYQNFGAVATCNYFANCYKAIEPYTAGSIKEIDNTITAQAVALGYSATNKGIAHIPFGRDYHYFHIFGDPTNASYGNITGGTYRSAASIPAAGTWIEGAFVQNSTPSISNSRFVYGWLRLTTGNGHVSGTDWAPLDIPVEQALMRAVEDQTVTGGAIITSKSLGTQSSGTLTLDMGDRPLQHYTNGGAHTLAPGTNTGSIFLDITNNASAGAITTSGFTKVTGDAFDTTNGSKFRCSVSVGNGGSLLSVVKVL